METITENRLLADHQLDYQQYLSKSISYVRYLEELGNYVGRIKEGIEVAVPHADYLPINFQRMQRVEKTAILNCSLRDVLHHLPNRVTWLVLSEHWCGDAAQILPLLHKLSEESQGKINLGIVFRDTYPELIDAHLTKGARAIPKLIQLDDQYQVTGTWGPRPVPAQELVWQLKKYPATASTYAEELHKWYAKDKTATTQLELKTLLELQLDQVVSDHENRTAALM